MGKPGVKDKLARSKTLNLSLLCTCASVKTGHLPILQPHIQPAPGLLQHLRLCSGFHMLWGSSALARVCFPRPESSSSALTPAYPGGPLGARQKGSTWPDGAELDTEGEVMAAEQGRHTPDPPRQMSTKRSSKTMLGGST